MNLGKEATRALLREIVREEMRTELNRILNPTFITLMTDGQRQMEQLFETVIAADEKYDELRTSLEILQRRVESLGSSR